MNKDVEDYMAKQKSPQKEICQKLREIILKTFPEIKEEMKYGVPYYDEKYYIVSLKDHVNLGFSVKNLTKNEINLFEGSGKTMKHIRVNNSKEIDEERIVNLLKMIK
jgi:uncharacterized protein YdhG (YjbR/CyaY superfamily)